MRRTLVPCLFLLALLGAGCMTTARPSSETATPRVVLDAPTRVRIRIVQNITLVQATLNHLHSATLIVDTGAQSTIISPSVAKRLGLVVPAQGARREVSVVGGNKLEVPFVRLAELRVGDARIEDMEVGLFEVTPTAKGIHGLLGADFLQQFRMILDRSENLLQLEPLRQ